MAHRNLTAQYVKLRSYYVKPQYSSPTTDYFGDDSGEMDDEIELNYLPSHGANDLESASQGSAYFHRFNSPNAYWIGILRSVRDDIKLINKTMSDLRRLHTEHLTPRFGKDFSGEEREIEIQTEEIKRLFQDCKKSIEAIDVDVNNIKTQEDTMLRNLKMSLITDLDATSKTFRSDQRDYLKRMKVFKTRQQELKPMQDHDELDPEERERLEELEQKMYDPGFTEEQVREMLLNEQDILRRDREIREILKSIIELQELFRDFSQLVIEQGTMLDRIDHNIEQTHHHVQKGNKNLETAAKMQKWSRMTLCILFLLVGIITLVVLVAAKIA